MQKLSKLKKTQFRNEEVPIGLTIIVIEDKEESERFISNEDLRRLRNDYGFGDTVEQQMIDELCKTVWKLKVKAMYWTYEAKYYRKINKDYTLAS